ncbi:hypothetical protein ACHAC9_07965 [Massilia sp. CMS3.1]|uniref:hypothetical protein n=1 Tax=Massilia sp. CMS3.1 TaxID=3373083 RepID=UPI003EE6523B
MADPTGEVVTGYQFIHKDWSARIQIEKKSTIIVGNRPVKAVAWSVTDLLSEALRIEEHIPHVLKPEPPGILYACNDEIRENPLKVADLADEWARSVKEVTGRAHQKNSPVMANGVISFPRERMDDWPAFRDASLAWLKKKYGERLKLVVEHATDEAHPHVHYYAVPTKGESFGAVHEGYGESRTTRRNKIEEVGKNAVDKKGKAFTKGASTGKAYIDAMKGYQDDFHNKVGKYFALARLGPQVEKLSHAEAIRQRNERKAEADRLAAEKLRDKADDELIAALEERRVSNLEMARKAAQVETEAEEAGRQMIEEARERSRIEAQRLMEAAKIAAEEKKRTIDALLKGDERVAIRVFKENVKLKEELRTTRTALAAAKQEIELLKAKFSSAYNWLKDAVKKLEFIGDFSFSRIFARQAVEELREREKARGGERDKGKVGSKLSSLPKPAPKGYKA